jgi:hypothetical protein
MVVYEGGEVIKGIVDSPQPFGAIIPLFVLEEQFCGLGRFFQEKRIPP